MSNRTGTSRYFAFWARSLIVSIVLFLSVLVFCQKLMDYMDVTDFRLIKNPNVIFDEPFFKFPTSESSRRFLPSGEHLLGLDIFGRDMLSRAAHSMATLIISAFLAVAIALTGGIFLGVLGGYYDTSPLLNVKERTFFTVGGIIDWINRLIASYPQIVVVILLYTYFERMRIYHIMIAFGTLNIPRVAEKVKAKLKYLKKEGFIESSTALGLRPHQILLRHLLYYQMRGLFLVECTFIMGDVVLFETTLSFLGFGARNDITLGNMMAEGHDILVPIISSMDNIPWSSLLVHFFKDGRLWSAFTCPGLLILFTILGFYLLGDGLTQRLKPQS